MSISIAGIVVTLGLYLLGFALRAPLLVALVASCAFGSTAIVTFPSLGGASPLLYNVTAAVLIASVLVRSGLLSKIAVVMRLSWTPWMTFGLIYYAVVSAVVMPRLFAGQTSAFAVSSQTGFVEVTLRPSAGNLLQTLYLVLFAVAYFALDIHLLEVRHLIALRRGFLAWAALICAGGVVDFCAKMLGAGDVLSWLRSADYAYLTADVLEGFARINGTFSEASSFAASALGALAFTYVYWKGTGSFLGFLMSACLLALLLLSTSTTAYLGLLVLGVAEGYSLLRSMSRGSVTPANLALIAMVGLAASITLLILATDQTRLDPAIKVIQTTVFDKAQSESGRERGYMNGVAIQNLFDTWGLGVGYGSSRSSSWVLALASQLGIIGLFFQALLFVPFLKTLRAAPMVEVDREAIALHNALRACTLALIVSQSISGTNANPGILFFVALAGVRCCRTVVKSRPSLRNEPDGTTLEGGSLVPALIEAGS